MQSNIKTIKGLNIALIVISSLVIFFCFLLLIAFFGVLSYASQLSFAELIAATPSILSEVSRELADYGLGFTGILGTASLLAFFFLLSGVSVIYRLIAAIYTVKNVNKPERLNTLFVLNLISTITAFVGGSIITGILALISTISIHNERNYSTRLHSSDTNTCSNNQAAAPQDPRA